MVSAEQVLKRQYLIPRDLVEAVERQDAAAINLFRNAYMGMIRDFTRKRMKSQVDEWTADVLARRSFEFTLQVIPHLLLGESRLLDTDNWEPFEIWVRLSSEVPREFDDSLKFAVNRQPNLTPQDQSVVLPPELRSHPAFHAEVAYLPSKLQLSGDYVASKCPESDGSLLIMLADATHHGFVPALETLAIALAFQTAEQTAPSDLLEEIEKRLAPMIEGRPPTCLIARFTTNGSTGRVEIGNAGTLNPGWLARRDEIRPIEIEGGNLGYGVGFDTRSFEIEDGDQVVLTTDGLCDLAVENGNLATVLPEFIAKNRGSDLHRRLHEFALFCRANTLEPGQTSMSDDVSFVTVTFRQNPDIAIS